MRTHLPLRWCFATLSVLLASDLQAGARGGLGIEEYVDIVLRSHPAMGSAQSLEDGAAAGEHSARLFTDPTLEVSIGRGRPADGSGPSKTETGVSVSQVIPWFPARTAAIEAAGHEARALRSEAATTRWGLAMDARMAYYRLLESRARTEVASGAEADARSLLDLMSRRASLGESREVDRIRSRVEWLRLERELRAAVRAADAAERIFRTLAREPLPEPLSLTGTLPSRADAAAVLEAATPERLEESPALARALSEALQAASLAKSARRGRIPEMAFTFFSANELDRESRGAALGITLPLWNARRGEIAKAEAESRLRSSAAESMRLDLLASLEARRRDVETLAEEVAVVEGELLPAAAESVRLARLLFEEGETSLLDLLDAQRTAREVRREEITARFELASATTELTRLLGPQTPMGEKR